MVVLIIDKNRVLTLEPEGQAPIAIDPNRPMAGQVPGQGVELPSRRVHVFWAAGLVQLAQKSPELTCMVWLNAGFATRREEGLKPFMAKAFDHDLSLMGYPLPGKPPDRLNPAARSQVDPPGPAATVTLVW